jgi:formyltetrahydrofolate-dependent phosphoribosylglycinamide formyltransferase
MKPILTPASVAGSERVQKATDSNLLGSAPSPLGDEQGVSQGTALRPANREDEIRGWTRERGRVCSAPPKNIAVLISGAGSNLQALISAERACQLGTARITTVICNRFKAEGVHHALSANIPVHLFSLAAFCGGDITAQKRSAYDRELAHTLNALSPDLIVLAGWMHIFSPAFLNAVRAPVINLHPALPGHFAGAHGVADAYAAWQAGQITHTGCMVHEIIEQIDAGKVIATQTVPCVAGDSLDDLKQRMRMAEHALIVRAVREYCMTQ